MNRKSLLKSLLINVFLLSLCGATFAASLELGQVRANRRGWAEMEKARASKETREVDSPAADSYVTEEPVADGVPEAFEDAPEHREVEVSPARPEEERRGPQFRSGSKRRSGLILIGREKQPSLKHGYLAVAAPPALRFSDADPVNARPPSPALPEFNFVSHEYVPYLLETQLSEDELNQAAMLSEIVIEMAPHEVVSGRIETRSTAPEELVEHFDLEEQRSTVLRPEEVLIYFETDTHTGKAGAVIPFSPATPGSTTIKSSATLNKE